MHASVLEWVGHCVLRYDLSEASVLEVGSLNINGSVRQFFTGPYHGIDIQAGPGVDEVVDAHDLLKRYPSQFDVIVSTEMLEHDSAPWLSLRGMRLACRPGGVLLLTCRGYDERGCWPLHEYPEDLWRFSTDGLTHLLTHTGWTPLSVSKDPEGPGVFAIAQA